jgi:hypothetical protein
MLNTTGRRSGDHCRERCRLYPFVPRDSGRSLVVATWSMRRVKLNESRASRLLAWFDGEHLIKV